MIGSLYFIQEGTGGAIKIGWTSNCPHRRRDNLQIGNSHDLVLLGIIPDVPRTAEAEWHQRFRDHCKRSEWFYPAAPLLQAIERQFPAPLRQTAPLEIKITAGTQDMVPLVKWMKKNRVRQTHLARHLGVANSTVSRIIGGQSAMSKVVAMQMELYTGGAVKAVELLGLESEAA